MFFILINGIQVITLQNYFPIPSANRRMESVGQTICEERFMCKQDLIKIFIILFSIYLTVNCDNFKNELKEKPRVIVTTDGEIDDRSSFIRFLLYTNDFDVEGIIATNSIWQKNGHGTKWILEEIDAHGKVRDNLLKMDDQKYQNQSWCIG